MHESDLEDGNWSASLGTAGMGTEIDITDASSTTTNFLVIVVALDNDAYATLAPQ